jgi:hypothetical protein
MVGANFIMYAVARGATKGGNSRWISSLKDSLSKSMDELRQKVEELEKKMEEEKRD